MVSAVTREQKEFVYRLSLGLARSKIDQLDTSVHSFIAELGDKLCSDRAYLITFEEATQTISITHEACRNGVTPQRCNPERADGPLSMADGPVANSPGACHPRSPRTAI